MLAATGSSVALTSATPLTATGTGTVAVERTLPCSFELIEEPDDEIGRAGLRDDRDIAHRDAAAHRALGRCSGARFSCAPTELAVPYANVDLERLRRRRDVGRPAHARARRRLPRHREGKVRGDRCARGCRVRSRAGTRTATAARAQPRRTDKCKYVRPAVATDSAFLAVESKAAFPVRRARLLGGIGKDGERGERALAWPRPLCARYRDECLGRVGSVRWRRERRRPAGRQFRAAGSDADHPADRRAGRFCPGDFLGYPAPGRPAAKRKVSYVPASTSAVSVSVNGTTPQVFSCTAPVCNGWFLAPAGGPGQLSVRCARHGEQRLGQRPGHASDLG